MGLWLVVWVRGRRKVDFSVKKSGGNPNPRIKKLGVRGYPQFFDSRFRVTPTFFTEKSTFRRPLPTPPPTPHHKYIFFN